MASTLFIVEDTVFTDLPQTVSDKALAETRRLFAFLPTFNVVTRKRETLPELLDFTDSIVKLVETDDEMGAVENQSIRIQVSNISFSARQHGINPTSSVPQHHAGTPDRGGVGFQFKQILAAGAQKLAMTLTGGVASLEAVKSAVVEFWTNEQTRQEILKRQHDAIYGKDKNHPQFNARYFARHEALVDERSLFVLDLASKPLAGWPATYQEDVGVALGRVIAHETRHQYVEPHFNGGGLGASEPAIFGDKNFEQFDKADQHEISLKIQKLATEQKKATVHLETLPKGQPFPF
jgi:hypothetical protein